MSDLSSMFGADGRNTVDLFISYPLALECTGCEHVRMTGSNSPEGYCSRTDSLRWYYYKGMASRKTLEAFPKKYRCDGHSETRERITLGRVITPVED